MIQAACGRADAADIPAPDAATSWRRSGTSSASPGIGCRFTPAVPVGGRTATGTPTGPYATSSVRSSEMLLINEDLARARMRELERHAEQARRVRRLVAARRWQRRARKAAQRARLAQSAVY